MTGLLVDMKQAETLGDCTSLSLRRRVRAHCCVTEVWCKQLKLEFDCCNYSLMIILNHAQVR